MVKQLAQEMAEATFEHLMQDNTRYKAWRELCPDLTPHIARSRFVTLAWPHLIEQARHTLAGMLNSPLDDSLKDQISEALILDYGFKMHHEHQFRVTHGLA